MPASPTEYIPNELLIYERIRRGWSQEMLANRLPVDPRTEKLWESGETKIYPHNAELLAELLKPETFKRDQKLARRQLGIVDKGEIPFWHVNQQVNPYFTGRENILRELARVPVARDEHNAFIQEAKRNKRKKSPQENDFPSLQPLKQPPQVLTGLAGVGKTQIAVAYAYRYKYEYHTIILLSADLLVKEDKKEDKRVQANIAVYEYLAQVFGFWEEYRNNQYVLADEVKRRLKSPKLTRWLLVFDNVDSAEAVEAVVQFLPDNYYGHVLLLSRMDDPGVKEFGLEQIRVPYMVKEDEEDGATLLLRRAGFINQEAFLTDAPARDREEAVEFSSYALGGLPLALDQAGAYIRRERRRTSTEFSIHDYATLYEEQKVRFLRKRGKFAFGHSASVAVTFQLCFKRVGIDARELLRFFAFLMPDDIPEELVTNGASALGSLLALVVSDKVRLHDAIENLLDCSLIACLAHEKLFSIHRLVQAVIQDEMTEKERQKWTERAVRAVNAAVPDVEMTSWLQWKRLLSQALVCGEYIEQQQMTFLEGAHLLRLTGYYLYKQGRFAEAEPLLKRALAIHEQQLGPEHPNTTSSLNILALLYIAQGKYVEAEPLLKQALATDERTFGSDHPYFAIDLNSLATLYLEQGKYAEAEPLYKRVLVIWEQQLGAEHLHTAQSLNNLAEVYRVQDKYAEAEPFCKRALAIREQQLGPEHLDTIQSLNTLAEIYDAQGKYAEAEPLLKRALAIREQQLGPEHPNTATSLNNLATLYLEQGKYAEAEPLLKRALAIREQQLGVEHPDTAASLNNLATLYLEQGKYAEAEPLYRQALAICERQLGAEHPHTTACLWWLAVLHQWQGKYEQAEPFLRQVLAIYEQRLGPNHSKTQDARRNYNTLIRDMKQKGKEQH